MRILKMHPPPPPQHDTVGGGVILSIYVPVHYSFFVLDPVGWLCENVSNH